MKCVQVEIEIAKNPDFNPFINAQIVTSEYIDFTHTKIKARNFARYLYDNATGSFVDELEEELQKLRMDDR